MILIHNPDISPAMKRKLELLGTHCVPSMKLDTLPASMGAHPDIQLHQVDKRTAVCAPECFSYYRERLPKTIKLIRGKKKLSGTYPEDSAYNAAVVGNYLFCNTKITDENLLEFYQTMNKTIIHVNQGYTKCNLCPIGEKILITEDIGIHNTIIDNQLPILSYLIPKGEILLPGFSYGFIGGCCGVYQNTIFWYGNPKHCTFGETILKITKAEEVQNIFLSEEKLIDLGGIICFA